MAPSWPVWDFLDLIEWYGTDVQLLPHSTRALELIWDGSPAFFGFQDIAISYALANAGQHRAEYRVDIENKAGTLRADFKLPSWGWAKETLTELAAVGDDE